MDCEPQESCSPLDCKFRLALSTRNSTSLVPEAFSLFKRKKKLHPKVIALGDGVGILICFVFLFIKPFFKIW